MIRIPWPTSYRPGDFLEAAKHDARQDWMIWLLRRGRRSEDVSLDAAFEAKGARIMATGAQTVAAGILTMKTMEFDTVCFDNASFADLANDRLVVPTVAEEGVYVMSAHFAYDGFGASGFMNGHIEITNPARTPPPYVAKAGHQSPGSVRNHLHLTATWPLFVGDRVRLRMQHSASTSLDTLIETECVPELSILRLGPWSGDAPA